MTSRIRFSSHTMVASALATLIAVAPALLSAQVAFDRTRPPAVSDPAPLTVPEVHAARLGNGAALRVVEHRELPLVQVTLQIAGGARLDRDMPGLASFVAGMLDEGAGDRDADTFQAEVAFLGASLRAGVDWDNTEVSLKVSRRNLEAALDLMADMVLRPRFGTTELERQRALRQAGLLQQKDQAGALASLAFDQVMFPEGHPYHRSMGGDSASTARLDSATVRAFHAGSFRPSRASFTVVGDIDEAEARRLLDARFGAWRASGPERTPAPVTVRPERPKGTRVYLVDKPDAAQSVIRIGAPGVERTSRDYAAIQVMNTILGGSFSSRLNTNLRETKGYTYGARSGFQWRPLPGAFVASSDVRTNVTDSSLVEFFRELSTITDSAVSPEELERAKSYLKLGLPGDLESTSQIAAQIADLAVYNLPLTWLREYAESIDAVTAEDVQRVAKRYVPAENAVVVVVGDLAKVRAGIEALGLGPVQVLSVDEITRE